MSKDHPFAAVLRIVGRGPKLSRSLQVDEAHAAMAAILAGQAEPIQIGAFLMVLRQRGETAAELAGFVMAARDRLALNEAIPAADLDWPSYADRHRQQPWFALAALLLARNGFRVLMHGIEGAAEGYAPTRPVLAALGVPLCDTPVMAEAALARHGIAYLGLERLTPELASLIDLRGMLGVRTVVNSFARALNPCRAPLQVQGVFHPPYRALHRDAALLLGQKCAAIFKGGAGEAQRNPLKPCTVAFVADGAAGEEAWPALLPAAEHAWREEDLRPGAAVALWRGELDLPVPAAAITGTAAIALKLAGRVTTMGEAQAMAETMWQERHGVRRAAE